MRSFLLVLDVDDTVYAERDFALSGFRQLDDWIAQTTGVSGFGAACAALFDSGDRRRIFDQALQRVGLPASPEMIDTLVARYRGHRPDIRLAPDAVRFLDRRTPALGLGVITDGPAETQRAKITALGLDRRTDHVICTGVWPAGQGKPHPRAFAAMEAWSGLAPDRHAYVGDNAEKDFVTPNARGWLTVQIEREFRVHTAPAPTPGHAAQATILSFDALEAALASLNSVWAAVGLRG